jgi:hypothetical protein
VHCAGTPPAISQRSALLNSASCCLSPSLHNHLACKDWACHGCDQQGDHSQELQVGWHSCCVNALPESVLTSSLADSH